jgi:hypothetical protein
MREYFPLVFIIKSKEHYCCWYTNEEDGFIVEENHLLFFDTLDELKIHSTKQKIDLNLKEDILIISIDELQKFVENDSKELDCNLILNYWNIIGDVSKSLGVEFYGDERSSILSTIYNKLFYGNNLPAVTPKGKSFHPLWEFEEIQEIRKVIQDGLRILNDVLKYGC